jgi:multidrug resistance efflux pump
VELENPAIEKEISELTGKTEILRSRIESLQAMRVRDKQAGHRLPATQEALRNLEKQIVQRQEQQRQLALKAPIDGVVLPAEHQSPHTTPNELPTWNGSPLDVHNAGCTLESGTTFCLIGDPKKLEAVAIVDQSDIEFVRVGQRTKIWLRQLPGRHLTGTIEEISDSRLDVAPHSLLAAGDLPVIRNEAGSPRLANSSFHVRIAIDPQDRTIPLRSTGWATIRVQCQPLARRVYRYLCSAFFLAFLHPTIKP